MAADFKLEIVSQGWLNGDQTGRYEDGSTDGCSHGSIYCEIGGVKITSDEPEYGTSQSALHLLRTLEEDRANADRRDSLNRERLPLDEGFLLCDGCGYPLSFGCTNFGTDWRVKHVRGEVILYDPVLVDAGGEERPTIQVGIPMADYRKQIVQFATEARQFYRSFGPRPREDWEENLHERFWAEFDERLARAQGAVQPADVNDRDISGSTSP
jgi:hypothetical protein